MAYTTINKSTDYFNTLLWTGNSGNQSITGNGFTADFTWSKTRSNAESHILMDTVRDAGTTLNQSISSNNNNAEGTLNNSSTLTVNSTGFDLAGTSGGTLNYNSYTYATWLWRAGGHTGSSNSDGTITSTVSANTTSGFSIVKYTGTGNSNETVGHGLSQAPELVIIKNLTAAQDWLVSTTAIDDTYDFLFLNTTAAKGDSSFTAPTASIINLNSSSIYSNTSGQDVINYCFHSVKGFSKIGSYIGNGNANGTFIYTGFKPAFVIVKNTSNTQSWYILDNKRNTYNPLDKYMSADTNAADQTATFWDYLSNGIKIRGTISGFNTSGDNYLYMAFAEAPLVGTNNIPATAG